jgi:Uma2 family endonuclease
MHAARPYIAGMPATALVTALDLERLTPANKLSELVRGVMIVREPPGYLHGVVTARLTGILLNHVGDRGIGQVLAGDPGFKLFSNPDTVRAPDVAFVRRERLPDEPPAGFASFAPDLVVEVLSPGDRPGEVLAKVGDWLSAGSALVWVVDAERRHARVYRADGSEDVVPAEGALSGEDVLPGFTCPLSSLL